MEPWILTLLATIAAALIILAVAYVLLRKRGAEPEEAARRLAAVLARAAEQQYRDPDARLDYVLGFLRERFPNVDADLLRALIEAAVYDLNTEQQEIAAGAISALSDTERRK